MGDQPKNRRVARLWPSARPWTDLAKNTVEDFSTTTARLLDQACAAGSTIAQKTQEGFRSAAEQTKRAGETVAGQR